jgi:hypothetical protein
MSRTKSDLTNRKWIKEFISSIRGGGDEKLIKSILGKVAESELDVPSINKILERIADAILSVGSNEKLLKILGELEKPIKLSVLTVTPSTEVVSIPNNLQDYQHESRSSSSVFVEGFLPRLPRHRRQNEVEWKKENKCSTLSADSLLDSTKCYGHREELTQLSTNVVPTQTQMSGFVKNGKVDLHKCYDEVMRRSESLHCENWSCDFERFKSLAMENGRVDENSAREAITVLTGEMLGLYRNAEREYYGKGVYGPDFKVIGQGEYSHVTHVEVKNPVGSDIEKASRNGYSDIVKQGNKIGDKISKQQSKWSNATFRASLSNLDPNAAFPQSPANTLGLVDEFDLPISEKMIVQNAVENNCTNTSNVIFINNETNI